MAGDSRPAAGISPEAQRTPLPGFLGRSALAWVIAAPIGLVLRMLWLGRGGIPIPFLLVTLAAGGLFLLGWRLIFWLLFLRPAQKAAGQALRLDRLRPAVIAITCGVSPSA